MIGNYVFTNQVSAGYANANIPPNYSWIQVDNNAGRPLYAQASYITNLDGLTVALTAGNVNIGDVHIADPITGLHADVANIGAGQGALRVLTQSFDAVHDTVSLGDVNDNYVKVNAALSALNVYNTNTVTSLSAFIINPQIEVTNDSGNPIPVTGTLSATVLNPVTAITVLNPITSVNIKSLVSNWDVLSAAIDNTTYTTLPSNPANEITILNNTGGTMYVKNAAKTIGLPIDNNTSVDLRLVGDTSEVAIKASSANKTVFATFISYN